MTLPWGEMGKDIYQQLYDKGFELAALLEKIDNAGLADGKTGISVLFQYLERLSVFDDELNLW